MSREKKLLDAVLKTSESELDNQDIQKNNGPKLNISRSRTETSKCFVLEQFFRRY